jgi:hypothetical protein
MAIRVENKNSASVSNSIVILERHSLENYVFYPFVFYSALSIGDREELKLPSVLNNYDITDELESIKKISEYNHESSIRLENSIQSKTNQYFQYLSTKNW